MRRALVVGIDTYPNMPLNGCTQDANDIATCLGLDQYDFDVSTILNKDATRSKILQKLSSLAYADEGGEYLLIYFAGHGQVIGNAGHLVTVDAQDFDPGISLAHLAQIMESASSIYDHVVAVLDCCHSGSAFSWANSRPLQANDIDREVPAVNESRCILAACRPEETAGETGTPTRGIFTSALTDGLLDGAVDYEGKVTLLGLYEYVSRKIPEKSQTPVFKGDIAGAVVLGSGFEPRVGPPIPDSELTRTLSKAVALVDEYDNLQQREWMTDRSHRLQEGAVKCARELERTTRWFQETKRSLPSIAREKMWVDAYDRLQSFRRNLSAVLPGQTVDSGQVVELIGHGGYGHVWLVQNKTEKYALKVFHGDQLDDDVRVQRFRNGYLGMNDLNHPRIVKVRELRLAPYSFSMDYIDGKNLRNCYLDRNEPELLLRLLSDIAETVQTAHSGGVRHRDIKPENIIVRLDENLRPIPYLTDFDLAYHETNRTVTTNLGVGGVINYAAPEQLYEPNTAAARAETVDVFSMGQLMYFIITGQDPSAHDFDKNHRILRQAVNSWIDERSAECLIELYRASTQRDVRLRPQTMVNYASYLTRAENYFLASSGNDSIDETRICARIAHLYAGIANYSATEREARCISLSGQLELCIRLASVEGARGADLAHIELEFSVSSLTVPELKSGTRGRQAINIRLDKNCGRFQNVYRRPGNKGAFQTYIHVEKIPLTVEGVAKVCDVIIASISAIEKW